MWLVTTGWIKISCLDHVPARTPPTRGVPVRVRRWAPHCCDGRQRGASVRAVGAAEAGGEARGSRARARSRWYTPRCPAGPGCTASLQAAPRATVHSPWCTRRSCKTNGDRVNLQIGMFESKRCCDVWLRKVLVYSRTLFSFIILFEAKTIRVNKKLDKTEKNYKTVPWNLCLSLGWPEQEWMLFDSQNVALASGCTIMKQRMQ